VEMSLHKHVEAFGGLWYSHCGQHSTKLTDRLTQASYVNWTFSSAIFFNKFYTKISTPTFQALHWFWHSPADLRRLPSRKYSNSSQFPAWNQLLRNLVSKNQNKSSSQTAY
jgi:hypothetical protein